MNHCRFRIVIMNWSGGHRVFVVETFIKNSDCLQRAFRVHWLLVKMTPILFLTLLFLLDKHFLTSGSAQKRKQPERPQTARTRGCGSSVHLKISSIHADPLAVMLLGLGFLINIARCSIPFKGSVWTHLCTMFGFNSMEHQPTLPYRTVKIMGE